MLMLEKDNTMHSHSQTVRSTSSLLSVDYDISISSCSMVSVQSLETKSFWAATDLS